jgi:hypothetical protein
VRSRLFRAADRRERCRYLAGRCPLVGTNKIRVRAEILDAYLLCAGWLAAESNRNRAEAMYNELNADRMPAPIRRAAALGLKAAEN